jgi:hypothetical protein
VDAGCGAQVCALDVSPSLGCFGIWGLESRFWY